MSYTLELTESSEFKVKHSEEVKQVLEGMGFETYNNKEEETIYFSSNGEGVWFDEQAEVILSKKPFTKDGDETNFVGVLSDWCDRGVEEYLQECNLEEEDVVIQSVVEYLQEELVDEKQYIAITCSGCEGRSWGNYNPFGNATFITKNNVEWVDLNCRVKERADKMKGDKDETNK